MTYAVDFNSKGEDLLLGLLNYDHNPKNIPHENTWPKPAAHTDPDYVIAHATALVIAPTSDWSKAATFVVKKEIAFAGGIVDIALVADNETRVYLDGVEIWMVDSGGTEIFNNSFNIEPGEHTIAFSTYNRGGPGATSFAISQDSVMIDKADLTWPCLEVPEGLSEIDLVKKSWTELTPANVVAITPPTDIPPIFNDTQGTLSTVALGDYLSKDNYNERVWNDAVVFPAPALTAMGEAEAWQRFSHGAPATELGEHAGIGTAQPANPNEMAQWTYDNTNDLLVMPYNAGSFTGVVSGEKYTKYIFDTIVSSNVADNDSMGVILGFFVGEDGQENTLSFQFRQDDGLMNGHAGALVINEFKPDRYGILHLRTPYNGIPTWEVSGPRRVRVVRDDDDFTIYTYMPNDHDTLHCTLRFNLNMNAYGKNYATGPNSEPWPSELGSAKTARLGEFRGPQPIGYCTQSQPWAAFQNLERPGLDSRNTRDIHLGEAPVAALAVAPTSAYYPPGWTDVVFKKRLTFTSNSINIRGSFDAYANVYIDGVNYGRIDGFPGKVGSLNVSLPAGEHCIAFVIPNEANYHTKSLFAQFTIHDGATLISQSDDGWPCAVVGSEETDTVIGKVSYDVLAAEGNTFTTTAPSVATEEEALGGGDKRIHQFVTVDGDSDDYEYSIFPLVQPKNTHTVIRTLDPQYGVKDVTVEYNRIPIDQLFANVGINLREIEMDMSNGTLVLNEKVFTELNRRYPVTFSSDDFTLYQNSGKYYIQAKAEALAYNGLCEFSLIESLTTRVSNTDLIGFNKDNVVLA